MLITLIIFPSPGFGAEMPNMEKVEGSGWYQEAVTRIQEEEYEVSWQEKSALPGGKPSYHMVNRAQDLRLYFSPEGISAIRRTGAQPSWILGWSINIGRSDKALPCLKPDIVAEKNRIEYKRNGVLEQYENLKSGIKQTLILEETIKGSSPLEIIVTFNGNMTPSFEQGDREIEFIYNNKAVIGFKDIKAKDAQGNRLPLQIILEKDQIVMTIDDRNAVYPVHVESTLASLPPWSMEGNQENALFGSSVATAGDVNGDGYSDIIIGAPNYDNGEAKEGKAFVYHGSPTGPSATSDFSYESNQVYAEMGFSVSTAGDINADGYSDVLIGARYYADGENDEGLVFIFLGSASGLYYLNTQGNNDEGAHFGSSVGPAGDFNGDGYSDIIVGAPSRSNNEGAAFIYYGTESGYFGSVTGIFSGSVSQLGCSVCTAGDVDRDGYSDVIIGASTYSNEQTEEGKVYVYFGKDSGIKGSWNYEYNYSTIHLGSSVSTAGDVNGDGFADVIVGAPNYTNMETLEGMVLVFYGSAAGLGNAPDLKIESHIPEAHFGYSVALAGDWDGDGYADVIVGAPGYQSDVDHIEEGGAYIFRGSSSGLNVTHDWFERSGQAGARFGSSVSTAGDVNGDGYSDVLIGAPGYDGDLTDEGKCFLYYGKPKPPTTYPDWNTDNAVADCDFAMTVAGAGDVNGDGLSDIMVGAPLFDNGETDEGRVYIYQGRYHNVPNTTANRILEPNLANAHFGEAIATAWDINGDGYDDIIIGAPRYGNDQGYVYIYYGSNTGTKESPDNIIGGPDDSHFGTSVSGAGDVNGDGYSDIIVGAPYYPNGEASGLAWINYGGPSGIMGDGLSLYGDQSSSYFGFSVSTAGDVNGDGYSDVIIGAPYYDNGQTEEGRAYVYYGSHNGVSSISPWIVESDQASSCLGLSVSTAGDVNGDGFSDVIIGAPYYDNGNTNEGAAFIYPGSVIGLFKTPIAILDEANQDNAMFGYSLAGAGDVNGDGFADVIVGAYLHDNTQLKSTSRPIINRTDAGSAYIYLGSPSGPSNTSDWSGHYLQAYGYFGRCVAGAGDVNGDGFADVIIGASGYVSSTERLGRAYLYLGGGGNGRLTNPKQQRVGTRVSLLGKTNNNSFTIFNIMFSPFGRGKANQEWEYKIFRTPLDGTDTYLPPGWIDMTSGSVSFTHTNALYPENTLIHWRVRVIYDPVTLPYQPHGPWITVPWNGWQEADFRNGPSSDPSLRDIINYLLGKSHYQHDINTDGKNDAGDVVKFIINH